MTNAEIDAQVAALLNRPYRKVITGDPEGGFVARVAELPGCITEGDTEGEALEMLRDAMAGWFEVALERGASIPPPAAERAAHSGRILVRTSKTLHRSLLEQAEEEGVSLNQLIVTYLAECVGQGRASAGTAAPVQASRPRPVSASREEPVFGIRAEFVGDIGHVATTRGSTRGLGTRQPA